MIAQRSARALFVTDLDGTLLDRQDGIHPRDAEAIARALADGIIVTIATGRLTGRTHPIARRLNLVAPLVCADGGVVACSATERVLRRRALSPAITERALELLCAAELSSFVCTHDVVLSCERGAAYHGYIRGWSHSISTHPDIRAACGLHVESGAVMVIGIGEEAQVESVRTQLEVGLGSELDLACFDIGSARVLRVVPKGTSKGAALLHLADELGVARERVAVAGDWYNDLSMFEAFNHAYAMPHAPQELKAKASHVLEAGAPQRGAIADALEHWLRALG